MKDSSQLRHIYDLARKSYNNNQYTFTSFLGLAEVTEFYDGISELPPCGYEISGGYEGAERVIIRFGKEEDLGYEEPFPIRYVHITPVMKKFADSLTHRDVLGSIMNLGMERDKIGDILIKDNDIWVMCLPALADVIIADLTRIKHTTVNCTCEEASFEALTPSFEEIRIQAPSRRIDAVVAKLCKLSRNSSAELFIEGKIAVNGRAMSNHSYMIKDLDIISVRGYGKFKMICECGSTKKGNMILLINKYV